MPGTAFLDDALRSCAVLGVEVIPVVDEQGVLLGAVTPTHVARAYQAAASQNLDVSRCGLFPAAGPRGILRGLVLTRTAAAVGQRLQDLRLPRDVLVVHVERHRQLLVPHEDTVLAAGDRLTLYGTSPQSLARAQALLLGREPARSGPETSTTP